MSIDKIEHTLPAFRVNKEEQRVFVVCSKCGTDVRELLPEERISVERAHYCAACDPGVLVMNPPSGPAA